ncbi:MAG: acetyl-CoA carboxylase biotin carboxyl carrier protein [Parvibaculales bacterium]
MSKEDSKGEIIQNKRIRKLADILKKYNLGEIEIEISDLRIKLTSKQETVEYSPAPIAPPIAAPAPASPAPAPQIAESEEPNDFSTHPGAVSSPMVGTCYTSPEPNAKSFISVGDSVKKGQTLFIVEAMKTMNPISAPISGTVAHILAENEQPVEFGSVLAVIE